MTDEPIREEPISDTELEAFLDEALSADEMAELERRVRDDSQLSRRAAEIIRRRDAGVHSLAAIWRRHRIGCPTREQLGSYLLQALDDQHSESIRFHLEEIGCRLCQANVEDLASRQNEAPAQQVTRRQRYFQSSAGYLERK